jgi:hypothetical protein
MVEKLTQLLETLGTPEWVIGVAAGAIVVFAFFLRFALTPSRSLPIVTVPV